MLNELIAIFKIEGHKKIPDSNTSDESNRIKDLRPGNQRVAVSLSPGKVGVLIIGYKRPQHFQRVLDVVADQSDLEMFISIDGSKGSEDEPLVSQVKKIAMNIPAHPSLHLRFLEENVGCREGVQGAIDWAFETVENLIILEDDCLPNREFFDFMAWGLTTFQNSPEVAMVSGWNELGVWPRFRPGISHLVTLGGIWGWATWGDRWRNHQEIWKEPSFDWRSELNEAQREMKLPGKIFRGLEDGLTRVFEDNLDSWDYQWAFTRVYCRSFSINPRTNLVTNIGFSPDSTHFNSSEPLMPVARQVPSSTKYNRAAVPSKIAVSKSYLWGQLSLGRVRWLIRGARKLRDKLWQQTLGS